MPEKVAHRACSSVDLNMHPCRQFPGHFVVHMPWCLYLLFCVARPLPSNGMGKRAVTWGTCPRGCEGTITRGRLLDKGGGGRQFFKHAIAWLTDGSRMGDRFVQDSRSLCVEKSLWSPAALWRGHTWT